MFLSAFAGASLASLADFVSVVSVFTAFLTGVFTAGASTASSSVFVSLELETPDTLTIQSVYIAHNMRVIELLNSFVKAYMFLDQTVGAGGLGTYTLMNTDIHIQNLYMLLILIGLDQ